MTKTITKNGTLNNTKEIINYYSNFKEEDLSSVEKIIDEYFGDKDTFGGDEDILATAIAYIVIHNHLNITLPEIAKLRKCNPDTVGKKANILRINLNFNESLLKFGIKSITDTATSIEDKPEAKILTDKKYLTFIFKRTFSLIQVIYYDCDRILIKDFLEYVYLNLSKKSNLTVTFEFLEKQFTELYIELNLPAHPEKGRDSANFVKIKDTFGNYDQYESLVFKTKGGTNE